MQQYTEIDYPKDQREWWGSTYDLSKYSPPVLSLPHFYPKDFLGNPTHKPRQLYYHKNRLKIPEHVEIHQSKTTFQG